MRRHLGDRALILGGSMAGLFAGHVLAGFFREVLVVDRDRLVGVDGLRRTTPQSFHAHALLARGQRAVEALLPGITLEFQAAGVPVGDVGRDLRWIVNGRRLRPVDTGLVCLATPRITLENRVRERLRALPNDTFLEYTDVLGLATTPDRRRVTGAHVLCRRSGGTSQTLYADLVVDTTGRGSRLTSWLADLGYQAPDEQRMRIDLGYATRHYRLPVGLLGTDLAYIVVQTPSHPHGAVFARERLLPEGGERYTLSLNGHGADRPPADEDAFDAYVRSLPVPHIHESIRDAEPLDDVRTYQFPTTLWRHYEQLDRFPEGLLAMGDSVASPNPVYAQGNTLSALEALALRRHLERGVPGAARYFADVAKILAPAWDVNIAGDIAHPGIDAEGTLSSKLRAASAFLPLVQRAAVHDEKVTEAFLRVAGLIDKPQALMRPDRVLRVLRSANRPAASYAELNPASAVPVQL
jgi:2-polyprenyl-6-methoxyphenol hydroxylase-like FAD-dependent oxidoreductase